MKKITLLFILCLTVVSWSYGQCTIQTYQFPTTTVNVAAIPGPQTIATNNWPQNEFSVLAGIVPGESYTVTADLSTFITITEGDGTTVITFGLDSVSFVATTTDIICYWALDSACTVGPNRNTLTQIECTTCTCTATAAPGAATAPTPADGATGIAVTAGGGVNFSWVEDATGDVADSFTISIGITATGDDIGSLTNATNGGGVNFGAANNTVYFWKIDAVNCFGSTTSAIWSFTTTPCTETAVPACVTVFTPVDNEPTAQLGAGGSLTFTWDNVPTATSYELFIDGFSQGPRASGITFTGFTVSTAFTWSVVPSNCFGAAIGCPTWNFTTSATLSIEDNEIAQPFKVYPNPTSGILNIKTSLEIDNIAVFNLLGQRVANFNSISNNSINLSELSQGLYIVTISAGDKAQTFKITKE